MTPYPDNFSAVALDRHQGNAAYERAVACASAAVADQVADATRLRDAAVAFLAAADGLQFPAREPTTGYDVAQIVEAVRDAAAIDVDRFRAELIDDYMDMDMVGV